MSEMKKVIEKAFRDWYVDIGNCNYWAESEYIAAALTKAGWVNRDEAKSNIGVFLPGDEPEVKLGNYISEIEERVKDLEKGLKGLVDVITTDRQDIISSGEMDDELNRAKQLLEDK